MSRDGSISFDWGDGHHRFRLDLAGLEEIQDKTGASPFLVLERLRGQRPMVRDAREVLRIGLVGGGLAPPEALTRVRRYADERPLAESIVPAIAVLAAALYGAPDDPPGKSEAAPEEPTAPPTG